jgi:two-component system response regulator AtoC
MMKFDILLVDDDKLVKENIGSALEKMGNKVRVASSGEQAKSKLERDFFHVVVAEAEMHEISGMALLQYIKIHSANTAVVLLSASGNGQEAVEAMKMGAFDYLIKPITAESIHQVMNRINELFARKSKVSETETRDREVNDEA